MTSNRMRFVKILINSLLLFVTSLSFAIEPGAPKKQQKKLNKEGGCEAGLLIDESHDLSVIQARLYAESIDFTRIKEYLKALTGESKLPGDFELDERHTKENREVTRLLLNYLLEEMGHKPTFEVFKEGTNLIVEIPGTDLAKEIVEIGAHYDSEGSSVPGADDNGTGVSLLLQLAKTLPSQHPRRTIRLIFFDLEEENCEGSCHHVQQLSKDPRNVVASLIVDMIGYTPKEAKEWLVVAEVGEDPSTHDKSDDSEKKKKAAKKLHDANVALARELNYLTQRLPNVSKTKLSIETDESLPDSGDHGSYWDENRPAILIAAPAEGKYVNPENHSSRDTIENMNWDYFVETGRLFASIAAYVGRVPGNAADILGSDRGIELIKIENIQFKIADAQKLPAPIERDPELKKEVKKSSSSSSSSSGWDDFYSYSEANSYSTGAYSSSRPSTPERSPKEKKIFADFKETYGFDLDPGYLYVWRTALDMDPKTSVLVIDEDGVSAEIVTLDNHNTSPKLNLTTAIRHYFAKVGAPIIQLESNPTYLGTDFIDAVRELVVGSEKPKKPTRYEADNDKKKVFFMFYPQTPDEDKKSLAQKYPGPTTKPKVESTSPSYAELYDRFLKDFRPKGDEKIIWQFFESAKKEDRVVIIPRGQRWVGLISRSPSSQNYTVEYTYDWELVEAILFKTAVGGGAVVLLDSNTLLGSSLSHDFEYNLAKFVFGPSPNVTMREESSFGRKILFQYLPTLPNSKQASILQRLAESALPPKSGPAH